MTYPTGVSVYSPKITNHALARKFVALNGRGYVAITVYNGSTAVDPDDGTLQLKVWFDDVTDQATSTESDPRGELVLTADAAAISKVDTGMYHYAIGPQHTGSIGVLTAQWSYQVGGQAFTYTDYLQILAQMPIYESLSDAEKSVVEQVSWMFGDLFDSTEGGPHLLDEFQGQFGYERIAQLAKIATTRFNTTGFPVTYYEFGPSGTTPSQFSGILVIGTYLEVVRHLMRTYIEQPAWQQMNVTYEDRRDYFQRWKTLFDTEWPDYQKMVGMAKRDLLQLGRGSLLLAGGIFGPGGGRGLFLFSPYAALTRSFRFYPAAPAISFPSTRTP